jgi:hypothetical protein
MKMKARAGNNNGVSSGDDMTLKQTQCEDMEEIYKMSLYDFLLLPSIGVPPPCFWARPM